MKKSISTKGRKGILIVLPLLIYWFVVYAAGHWFARASTSWETFAQFFLIAIFAIAARALVWDQDYVGPRVVVATLWAALLCALAESGNIFHAVEFAFQSDGQRQISVAASGGGPVLGLVVLQIFFTLPVVILTFLLSLVPDFRPMPKS